MLDAALSSVNDGSKTPLPYPSTSSQSQRNVRPLSSLSAKPKVKRSATVCPSGESCTSWAAGNLPLAREDADASVSAADTQSAMGPVKDRRTREG